MKIGDRVEIISYNSNQRGLIGTIIEASHEYIKINKLSHPVDGLEVKDIWCTRRSFVRLCPISKIIKVI